MKVKKAVSLCRDGFHAHPRLGIEHVILSKAQPQGITDG